MKTIGTVALIDRIRSIDLLRSFLMVTIRVSVSVHSHSNMKQSGDLPSTSPTTADQPLRHQHQLIQLLYNTTRVLKHGIYCNILHLMIVFL